MALPPPLDPRPPSVPVNHPPGAPREVNIAGCTICLTSGEERIRLEWDQKLGQDSWNPPEHFQGGLKDTEPTAGCPKLPVPSFPEDLAGGKYCEVFEEANTLDQDLEVEGHPDWPGPGGLCSPWTPSSLPTLAELEWDPAGDVGGLGPLGQKTTWTPGDSCELCGHRGPQSRGQGLEVRAGMGRFHSGTHRTPLHTSQQGPSLSRRFGGLFSFCLSVSQCLSLLVSSQWFPPSFPVSLYLPLSHSFSLSCTSRSTFPHFLSLFPCSSHYNHISLLAFIQAFQTHSHLKGPARLLPLRFIPFSPQMSLLHRGLLWPLNIIPPYLFTLFLNGT
ncbi:nesprin-4 isoform X3 [Rousettus aegyptiacus]|uniref:nesprin-4 isoform X3 n=1 Tax=Rousettus aegyptiacus TaxID=9407 RepID=UPI00168D3705|nr:nesprin-4 isoform X3 [Rousettus aegyptiacus]